MIVSALNLVPEVSQETPQGQQVALAQAPIKLLLLPGVPVHMKFCEIVVFLHLMSAPRWMRLIKKLM